MKDLGQNFQTFDDARSRAVEILIAVGDEDATVLRGLQLAPARSMFKQRHLVKRSLYVKAARVHQNDIRVGDNKLVPIEPWRRLTRCAKQILAAGHFHEFRHPVATGHQRIDPLDHGGARARSRCGALLCDAGHARLQSFNQMFALPFAFECAGHFSDVLPDVGEGVRLKGYDLYLASTPGIQRRLDIFEAYRTDLAMVLGDDDIGAKPFDLLRIDAVDGEPFLQNGLDAGVYVVARAAHREFRLG